MSLSKVVGSELRTLLDPERRASVLEYLELLYQQEGLQFCFNRFLGQL